MRLLWICRVIFVEFLLSFCYFICYCLLYYFLLSAMDHRKRNCIFGCDINGISLHKFPNPERNPALFSDWVNIIGDKLEKNDPMMIFRNKRVCGRHFEASQKTTGHRLVQQSRPTLNLKCVQRSVVTIVEAEHKYASSVTTPCSLPTASTSSSVAISSITADEPIEVSEQVFIFDNQSETRQSPSTSVDQSNKGVQRSLVTLVEAEHNYASSASTLYISSVPAASKSHDMPTSVRRQLKYLKNETYRLRAKIDILKRQRNISNIQMLEKITENMTVSAKLLTRMQVEETKKARKGRRYTIDEKILALSLYKRSPKSYKFLHRILTLPSQKSLKQVLSQIKIGVGINTNVFEELKRTVSTLNVEDRLVTLIFDEMSLTPQIHYNAQRDELIGFKNCGEKKSKDFADHALLFMVKGIKANFKQPVAYYFTRNMKTCELKNLVINIIQHIQNAGLVVVATVCDQCTLNVSTINSLIQDTKSKYLRSGLEWRNEYFEVNSKRIIPLYDVPHLIKGVRNNLLNKDLIYKTETGDEKKVKWEYLEKVYVGDKNRGELRLLHKVTNDHIEPKNMRKMKVKIATQVLSRTMAVATDLLVSLGKVPQECGDMIPFLMTIDKLFDSLNSSTFQIPNGNIYKGPVRMNSPHHTLWEQSCSMLKSAKFVKDSVEKSVPTLKNFVKTIEGFKALWQILNQKYNLDCMLTRNFNQDPIENFFGNIRSMGARNVSPDCVGFEGAYKTLLINNYSSTHSISSNCEEDFNECLQTYTFFLNNEKLNENAPSESHHFEVEKPIEDIININVNINLNEDGIQQRNYVTGWILTKCLQKVKGCKQCKKYLCGDAKLKGNEYIRLKEFNKNKKWLCYPSKELSQCFKEIQRIVLSFIKSDCHVPKIKERIIDFAHIFVDFEFIQCSLHKNTIINFMTDRSIKILIYSWCRSINRILSGKIIYDGDDDDVKKAAQLYHDKFKHLKCKK